MKMIFKIKINRKSAYLLSVFWLNSYAPISIDWELDLNQSLKINESVGLSSSAISDANSTSVDSSYADSAVLLVQNKIVLGQEAQKYFSENLESVQFWRWQMYDFSVLSRVFDENSSIYQEFYHGQLSKEAIDSEETTPEVYMSSRARHWQANQMQAEELARLNQELYFLESEFDPQLYYVDNEWQNYQTRNQGRNCARAAQIGAQTATANARSRAQGNSQRATTTQTQRARTNIPLPRSAQIQRASQQLATSSQMQTQRNLQVKNAAIYQQISQRLDNLELRRVIYDAIKTEAEILAQNHLSMDLKSIKHYQSSISGNIEHLFELCNENLVKFFCKLSLFYPEFLYANFIGAACEMLVEVLHAGISVGADLVGTLRDLYIVDDVYHFLKTGIERRLLDVIRISENRVHLKVKENHCQNFLTWTVDLQEYKTSWDGRFTLDVSHLQRNPYYENLRNIGR